MGKAIGGVSSSPPLSEGGGGTAGNPQDGDTQADGQTPSIGKYLAKQRRLRRIDLDELVAVTRIPRRSLERLESGAFDGVTDGFVRGFVRTVAEAIGLDPDDAVTRMLDEPKVGPARAWPDLGRSWAWGTLGVAVLLLFAFLWGGATEPAEVVEAPPAASAPIAQVGAALVRRDAVRDLARERGLLNERGQAREPARLPPTPSE